MGITRAPQLHHGIQWPRLSAPLIIKNSDNESNNDVQDRKSRQAWVTVVRLNKLDIWATHAAQTSQLSHKMQEIHAFRFLFCMRFYISRINLRAVFVKFPHSPYTNTSAHPRQYSIECKSHNSYIQ